MATLTATRTAARRRIVATPGAWLVWGAVVFFFVNLAGVIGSVVVSSFGSRWFDTWLPPSWTHSRSLMPMHRKAAPARRCSDLASGVPRIAAFTPAASASSASPSVRAIQHGCRSGCAAAMCRAR